MADNNKVSVKVGDKVYSWDNNFAWTDVTATYPYIGGTTQTEFEVDPGPTTQVLETGGYFIYNDMIWRLAKLEGLAPEPDYILAAPLYPTDYSSEPSLPIFIDSYNYGASLYSDDQYEHKLTEIPQSGDSFYITDGDLVLIPNAVIYDTITAGSTATDVPPAPPVVTYDKPLIYNSDLDCIEKSLSNIEVVGDFKAGSITTPELNANEITTPSLTATEATIDDLTVNNPVENLRAVDLTVTDTATINHATIVTEEDIHSEADFIELRVGNPLPTPSTGSGFKVKNYDGDDEDLELVTDSSGTFRIGAENQLQPILTRDEEADLSNGAPLVWNAAQHKAQTSSTPDGNKVLKSVKDSVTGVVTYEWSSSGSGAVWRGTQAQLTTALAITDPNNEAYIPNNAMIIVTDAADTYLTGEEQ